jgi:ketosteroid isomerase-like protein
MTPSETAKAFTDLLKADDHHGAAAAFNSPDIVSIEAFEGPTARVQGTAAIKAKSEWWYGAHEVHSIGTQGPYMNGDQFSLIFAVDVTERATGKRTAMQEVGLYTIKDGKIVEERFFY